MMSKNVTKAVLVVSVVLLFAFSVFGGTARSAAARTPVIAFIDFDQAGEQYTEARVLLQEYQADVEYYNSLLRPLENELMQMQSMGNVGSDFQLKQNEYLLQKQRYQTQIQNKYTPRLDAINEKLIALAKEYAQINGIDVLMTNKVAIYVDFSYDVTQEFVTFANSRAQ